MTMARTKDLLGDTGGIELEFKGGKIPGDTNIGGLIVRSLGDIRCF